jgi:hypothetical protein
MEPVTYQLTNSQDEQTMQPRPYKLYWTATATTAAVASTKIIVDGNITSIAFALAGQAGAGVTGCQRVQLSKLVFDTNAVNDTPPKVLGEASLAFAVSGASANLFQAVPHLSIPVRAGEILYAHQLQTGTAPAASFNAITVYVE